MHVFHILNIFIERIIHICLVISFCFQCFMLNLSHCAIQIILLTFFFKLFILHLLDNNIFFFVIFISYLANTFTCKIFLLFFFIGFHATFRFYSLIIGYSDEYCYQLIHSSIPCSSTNPFPIQIETRNII